MGVSYLGETVLHCERYYKSSSGAYMGGHTVLFSYDPGTAQWSGGSEADELTFPGKNSCDNFGQRPTVSGDGQTIVCGHINANPNGCMSCTCNGGGTVVIYDKDDLLHPEVHFGRRRHDSWKE